MSKRSRTRARRWTTAQLKLQTRELDRTSQRAPAIVFAPHPDDETLGCGGTILKKRSLGAPVEVVFLTDGYIGNENQILAAVRDPRDRRPPCLHEVANQIRAPVPVSDDPYSYHSSLPLL